MNQNRVYDTIFNSEPITKGWSEDKKFCVTTTDGTKYLLRVSPSALYETRKSLFAMTEKLATLGMPICKPIEFGICSDGIYTLHEWIDGTDLEDVLPNLTESAQYALGMRTGEILKTIHSANSPTEIEDWATSYGRKIDIQLQKYLTCGKRFCGDEYVLGYVENNRHLTIGRPQVHHHGDYSWKNTMLLNGNPIIIDFERLSIGCPFEEFFL